MVESSDARRPDVPEVVVAVLRDQDRVLLCHRSPGRRWYPNVWDLPGGHVEPGERPAAALVRELAEELGIRVREPSPEPAARIRADDFDLRIWVLDTWAGPGLGGPRRARVPVDGSSAVPGPARCRPAR